MFNAIGCRKFIVLEMVERWVSEMVELKTVHVCLTKAKDDVLNRMNT